MLDNLSKEPSTIDEVWAARKARMAEQADTPGELEGESEVDETEEAEADELEEAVVEGADAEDDGGEEEFFLIDGEETPLETILEWKQGNLRQSDYTSKTTSLAEQRKALEATLASNAKMADELEAVIDGLQGDLLKRPSDEDLDELLEDDPSAYLKVQKEIEAKKSLIASARSKAKKLRDENSEAKAVEEQRKLFDSNPDWLDNGKPTEKFQTDSAMMSAYLDKQGWTPEEVKGISTARQWNVIKAAAEADLLKSKNSTIVKKVKKAPKVTKPGRRGSIASADQQKLDQALAKAKRTGDVRDIHAARKLRNKLQGN